MDFVVVGLGLGALAILGGVLLLGLVAGRWERTAASASTREDAAYGAAMAAGRRGAGQALLGAGGALILATIGALAGSLDDRTGAYLITTTATVAGLGLLVWAYLHRARNPLPPRRRPRPAPMHARPSPPPVRYATPPAPIADLPLAERAHGPAAPIVAVEGETTAVASERAGDPDPIQGDALSPRPENALYSFMVDDSVPDPATRQSPYSFMQNEEPPATDAAVSPDDASVEAAPDTALPETAGATAAAEPAPAGADDEREDEEAS